MVLDHDTIDGVKGVSHTIYLSGSLLPILPDDVAVVDKGKAVFISQNVTVPMTKHPYSTKRILRKLVISNMNRKLAADSRIERFTDHNGALDTPLSGLLFVSHTRHRT